MINIDIVISNTSQNEALEPLVGDIQKAAITGFGNDVHMVIKRIIGKVGHVIEWNKRHDGTSFEITDNAIYLSYTIEEGYRFRCVFTYHDFLYFCNEIWMGSSCVSNTVLSHIEPNVEKLANKLGIELSVHDLY